MMHRPSWLKRWAARLLTRALRRRSAYTIRHARLRFEPLEDRTLLSVVNWTGQGDGVSWFDAHNWVGGHVPGDG